MPKLHLTKTAINQLHPSERVTRYWDTEITGFGLKITPANKRTFIFAYRMGGRGSPSRTYTIGPTTPHLARQEAKRLQGMVANGRDPGAERKHHRRKMATDRIEDVAESFIEKHVSQLKSARDNKRLLRREVVSKWGKRSIHSITRTDVSDLLNGIVDRGAPTAANRTLAALRKMFNWSLSHGIIDSSPCTGISAPTKERPRDRFLSDDELTVVMRAIQEFDAPYSGIVKMLVYTAARRSEIAEMKWDEINIDAKTWTLPSSRAKNSKTHIVHLSQPALEVLANTPHYGPYVFTTDGKTPFQNLGHSKRALDDTSGVTDWWLHDIRRTVVTAIAGMGIPPHIADALLNHKSGTISGVAAVYQKNEFLPERRDALDRWAEHVQSLLGDPGENTAPQGEREQAKRTSNVIPLNRVMR